MIFVTIGTHPESFERLLKQVDKIAPKVKDKIIIQRGFTTYVPKNCEYFEFAPSLDAYFKSARLVISQSATSLTEFVHKTRKPVITVPRQKKYHEHLNDHQLEFAYAISKKTGIKMIDNINELTPELLNNYKTLPKINKDNLKNLQNTFIKKFAEIERWKKK